MNPRPPLVSIVIPVFNKEKTLAQTLDSVRAQTLGDYEVILVDDGSTDASLEIAGHSGLPLRVFRQENGGPSRARNRGIRESEGTYVAFLDADDLWEPHFLMEMTAALRETPGVRAMASAYRIVRSGRKQIWPPDERRPQEGRIEDFFRIYRESRFCWTSAVVIERSLLMSLGGYREDLWIGEDVELWCRIGATASWGYVPRPLATYCDDDPNSLTRSSSRVSRSADLWVWEKDLVPILSAEQMAGYRSLRWQLLKTQMGILLQARELERFRAHASVYRNESSGCKAWVLTGLAYLPAPALRLLAWFYAQRLRRRRGLSIR